MNLIDKISICVLITFTFNFFELNALEINEIFPDPKGQDTKENQWIEIKNSNPNPFNNQITLSTQNEEKKISINLEPYQLIVVPIDLKNNDEKITIKDEDGIIDQIIYSSSQAELSYQKIKTTENQIQKTNWIWAKPTPNANNLILTRLKQPTIQQKTKKRPQFEIFLAMPLIILSFIFKKLSKKR